MRRVVFASLALSAFGCEGLIGANFDRGRDSAGAEGGTGTAGDEGGSVVDAGSSDAGSSAKDAGGADARPRGDAGVIMPAACGDMSGYAVSAWPMGGFCPTRPNRTSAPALASPHILWRYDFGPANGQEFVSGPALTGDGTVLAAGGYFTDAGGLAYALFAVKDKVEQWRAPLPVGVVGTPTVAKDGTIYVHAAQVLIALHPNGSQKWSLPLSGPYVDMPVILGDGTVVVLDGKQMVFVDPAAGTAKSSYPLGSGSTPTFAANIAVSPQGVLYALAVGAPGNLNALLYGVNSSAMATFSPITLNGGLPNSPPVGPAFDAQGNLLVVTNMELSMWTPQGTAAGSTPSGRAPCQPLGAMAGNLFWFPSTSVNGPFSYDTSNQQLADHATVAAAYSGIVAVGDGSLVFARRASSASPKVALEAFGPDVTSRWTVPLDTIGSDFTGLAVGADGTVYLPFGPTLYAIGD